MKEKDISQVYEIESKTFSLPWSENDFRSSMINSANIYLVAEEKGQILGYCGLWGIAGEGHINNVAVAHDFRDKGIAYAMLTELIKQGKRKELETFTLEVRISNHPAIKLYRNLGFRNAGIRPNFYENPKEDALIMWL
jgi:[ribosomal protein S18]-alanine N-acetyltransferase